MKETKTIKTTEEMKMEAVKEVQEGNNQTITGSKNK